MKDAREAFSSNVTAIKHSSKGIDLSGWSIANPTLGHGVLFYKWRGLEVNIYKYHSLTMKNP